MLSIYRSMVIAEVFFTVHLKLFAFGIFLRGLTLSFYERPLYWKRPKENSRLRLHNSISDEILDGIFPHSSQNLSFELFQRLLALGYYFVLKVCGCQLK